MRASIALLPALAAMTVASRCRPWTTTSSLESSTLTSTVISSTIISEEPTSSAISVIESTTTTASAEPTTSEATFVEPSTTEPAASELPTTTEPPTITEEPTTTTAESVTSTEPSILPTITDFCLKVITPNVPTKGYHISGDRPYLNMNTEPSYSSRGNFARFNLDTSTGRMTISSGTWAGYELYTPGSFNGLFNVVRFTDSPVEYPLNCSNPDGVYTTGSVLKCELHALGSNGAMRRYARFSTQTTDLTSPWMMLLDGYVRVGAYTYDLGMFFGDDCVSPNDGQR